MLSYIKDSHLTWNVLLLYLVKVEGSKTLIIWTAVVFQSE